MLEVGDFAIHGEEPYTFQYYNRSVHEKTSDGAGIFHGQAPAGHKDEESSSGDGSRNGEKAMMGKTSEATPHDHIEPTE